MDEQASFHPLHKDIIRRQNLVVEWVELEYQPGERGRDWFWVVGIITVAVAMIAFLFDNWLLALLAILAGGILMIYAVRPPNEIVFSITANGVRVKNRLYPFANIKSFAIRDHIHGPVLILDVEKFVWPIVVLPIAAEVDIGTLHRYLEAFVPEGEHHLPLAELVTEYLGF